MFSIGKFFLLLIALPLINSHRVANSAKSINRYQEMEELDALHITRCDAVCWSKSGTEHEICHNQCMSARFTKPGWCPANFEELSVFERACVRACADDSQCPETEKCCSHSCGVTCQTPEGLFYQSSSNERPTMKAIDPYVLPAIPYNVSARELAGKSIVEITWTSADNHNQTRNVLYVIQSRHHDGRYFNEDYLRQWVSIYQAKRSPATIRNVIQTARWYVFRIAAVSENGTLGFSKPSEPFLLSRSPSKPSKPKKLCVVNVYTKGNNQVWGEVRWSRPRSELPIQRYKVFWSKRLKGGVTPPPVHPRASSSAHPRQQYSSAANDDYSILVHQHSVPKNQSFFQLENLERNELYFIQVQALAIYGKDKLKGFKAGIFFNTTRIANQCAPTETLSKRLKKNKSKSSSHRGH